MGIPDHSKTGEADADAITLGVLSVIEEDDRANRYTYYLAPQGFAEKSRLTAKVRLDSIAAPA